MSTDFYVYTGDTGYVKSTLLWACNLESCLVSRKPLIKSFSLFSSLLNLWNQKFTFPSTKPEFIFNWRAFIVVMLNNKKRSHSFQKKKKPPPKKPKTTPNQHQITSDHQGEGNFFILWSYVPASGLLLSNKQVPSHPCFLHSSVAVKGFEKEQVEYILPWGILLEANSLLGTGKRWPRSQSSRRPWYLCCPSEGHYTPAMARNRNPEAAPVSGILRKLLPAEGRRAGKGRV